MADAQETCDPNWARKASIIEKPQTLPNQYSLAVVLPSVKQNRINEQGQQKRQVVQEGCGKAGPHIHSTQTAYMDPSDAVKASQQEESFLVRDCFLCVL